MCSSNDINMSSFSQSELRTKLKQTHNIFFKPLRVIGNSPVLKLLLHKDKNTKTAKFDVDYNIYTYLVFPHHLYKLGAP